MASNLVSVIVPVYNERNTVAEVVRRARYVDLPAGLEREIIVVDDGSTDNTLRILQTIEDSTVRVVCHAKNLGQGAAVRSGLEAARGEIVLIQDADLEYDPNDIPRLLSPILSGAADVVYGSRFHPQNNAMRLTQLVAGRSLSAFTCLLYNTTLSDIETGARAFRRSVIDAISIQSNGFDFGPEITAKLLRSGARFSEVPVQYMGTVGGRSLGVRDRVAALQMLVRQRFGAGTTLPQPALDALVIDIRDQAQAKREARS